MTAADSNAMGTASLPAPHAAQSFPAPPGTQYEEVTIEVDTVLFDMDGTLIDSTPAVNATWREFAVQYNLDIDYVMQSCHGWRTIENLRRFVPSISEEQLPAEVERFETRIGVIAAEATRNGTHGAITAMPGAKALLAQIEGRELGGDEKDLERRRRGWAIVTSATKAYAHPAFASTSLVPQNPAVFVTSDICSKGKPDPEPYLHGARLSFVDPKRCLVVEDAPPGLLAGHRTGAKTLGLRTTHDGRRMWEQGADFVVGDLSDVSARWEDRGAPDGPTLLITMRSEKKPLDVQVTLSAAK